MKVAEVGVILVGDSNSFNQTNFLLLIVEAKVALDQRLKLGHLSFQAK